MLNSDTLLNLLIALALLVLGVYYFKLFKRASKKNRVFKHFLLFSLIDTIKLTKYLVSLEFLPLSEGKSKRITPAYDKVLEKLEARVD